MFSKSFIIKSLVLLLEEKNLNSQKIWTSIGGKIPQGQITFWILSTEKTYTTPSHKTQNKGPSYHSTKWHPLITQLLYSLPAASPNTTILSEVSQTKQAPLKSAYSMQGASHWACHMSCSLSRFSNILAKNSSKGRAQARHAAHVKKIPYIFHGLIQDTRRNRPRHCWINSGDRKEPSEKK